MYELVRGLDPEGVANRQFGRQNIPRGDAELQGLTVSSQLIVITS